MAILQQEQIGFSNLIGDGTSTSVTIELTELPLATKQSLPPLDGLAFISVFSSGLSGITVSGSIAGTVVTINFSSAPALGLLFGLQILLSFPLD
jgi:hypothetical protein